jgi:aryl-alcohol dehydrogenase-like predicted oxidoreductase
MLIKGFGGNMLLAMRKRKLGFTELELTTVGIGTWAMGGPWQYGWGPQDDNDAVAGIVRGLEAGINWIDTAPIYGLGHSEELVAKALKQTKSKPIIATKCGLLWDDKGKRVPCLKKASIRKECEESLRRLGVEIIDLYQMHWPGSNSDTEQAWGEMARLAQEGKVRYIGASNFTVEQMKRVQRIAPVASLQPPYSMVHREVEKGMLAFCAKNNIGALAYSPIQRGLLTGKFGYERLASLAPDDHRRTNADFQEPRFGATLELVEGLKPIAKRKRITLAQLAVGWVLRRSEVTAAILGVRKPEQIAETAAGGDVELSEEEIKEIEKLLIKWQGRIDGK